MSEFWIGEINKNFREEKGFSAQENQEERFLNPELANFFDSLTGLNWIEYLYFKLTNKKVQINKKKQTNKSNN